MPKLDERKPKVLLNKQNALMNHKIIITMLGTLEQLKCFKFAVQEEQFLMVTCTPFPLI